MLRLATLKILISLKKQKKTEAKILNTSQNLRDDRTEVGKRLKVDAEQESNIARTTFIKDSSVQNLPLMQAYQDNAMIHHQQIFLYNFKYRTMKTTDLSIYNTEIEAKKVKIIQTSERLNYSTCVDQVSNGKLFCYGNSSVSGITLIIDESGGVQVPPSGIPCYYSSAIHFNNNIYCLGGYNNYNCLTLSHRFDLDRNELNWNHYQKRSQLQ